MLKLLTKNITVKVKLCMSMLLMVILTTACTQLPNPVMHQYQLTAFSRLSYPKKTQLPSLFVAPPDAIAGYQSEQMLYTKNPYELKAFIHNSWVSAPANMLYPLMLQSLQQSKAFIAVTGGANTDKTDYRLDTQVLGFQQNFTCKPSVLEWKVQVVLTQVDEQRVVAARIFYDAVPCTSDTPYGGACAANQAARHFTSELTKFVVRAMRNDA